MEPLFEIRYTNGPNDSEYTKELYRRLMFSKASIVGIVALLILVVWRAALFGFADRNAQFLLLLIILFVAARIYRYFLTVKLSKKRYLELYGNVENEMVISVTSDAIHFSGSVTDDVDLSFLSISKVYRTKRLVILQSDAKILYSIRLNAFAKGTPEEFIDLLRLKGLKVR